MKKITQNVGKLIICLVELLVGVLLLVNPVGFTTGILVLAGAALAVLGVLSVIRYFRIKPELNATQYHLATGLISVAAGLFCIFRAEWIISKFPIITILYGLGVLVIGFIKVQNAVDLLRLKITIWPFNAINALLTLIFAVIVLVNPFSTKVLWMFLAITLIVVAVLDIAALILSWIKPKEKKEDAEEPEEETEE